MRALPVRHPPMAADQFIEWAMTLPKGERYELVAGEVVAMSPERLSHVRAKGNIYVAFWEAIRRRVLPCEVLPDGMAVRIDDETVYEPDAIVRCGPELHPDTVQLTDPVIVVEVVSPSSGAVDKGAKLEDYFRLPSVRHYLIVRTGKRRSVIHYRRDDGGHIQIRILHDGALELAPPGIAVAVEDLFD